MEKVIYSSLQLVELFHLIFLRWFSQKVKAGCYSIKGGTNLRFFYNSVRYSEDMDIDVQGLAVEELKKIVMDILISGSFTEILKPFSIEKVVAPDISRAKQTETTQRFKIHLITQSGEDHFTKIEFSRRTSKGHAVVGTVTDAILRTYKLPPLVVSHYDIQSAILQKIDALANRSVIQARDIFDLYVLNSQCDSSVLKWPKGDQALFLKARENIYTVSYDEFRDKVVLYLQESDTDIYNTSSIWDEIRLKVDNLIKSLDN